jgi:hypothetical protein
MLTESLGFFKFIIFFEKKVDFEERYTYYIEYVNRNSQDKERYKPAQAQPTEAPGSKNHQEKETINVYIPKMPLCDACNF